MQTQRRPVPLTQIILMLYLTAAMMLKSYVFYSDMRLLTFDVPLCVATGGIFLLIYLLISMLSPRAAKITAICIYWIASFAMGVDSVYYTYMSKLPSAALLGMVNQLDDVSDTIEQLIKLRDLLMIADLPFLFAAGVNSDIIGKKLSRRFPGFVEKTFSRTKSAAAMFTICLASSAFIMIWPEFEPEYLLNELFCYHTSDIVKTLGTGSREREVDKSLYAEADYSDSKYWGIAENRNVIIIQVEALQNFVIGREYEGQEIMPNLNAMIAGDSFYFPNYYYQIGGGNTSDAEFAVNNSLFAPENDAAYVKYPNNGYHGLPYLLKENGYSGAHAFHAYIPDFWNRRTAYPGQGFDSFMSLDDMEQNDMFAMGLSDIEMFRQSMEELKTYEEPFYAFYVTLSSHYPYGIPLKDREIALNADDEQTLYGLYLQAVNYADRAIGAFMEMLDEAGLYDNSVIVIYGDHYALANTDANNMEEVTELLGRPYSVYDVFSVPLIIHIPGMDRSESVSTAGGHIDVLPTILPLLGIRNDKAVMFGRNLLEDKTGIVCQQTHMGIGSFISNEVFFKKPHNNIKGNYDAYAYGTMECLDPDLFREMSDACTERIADCAALLERNDIMLD